MEKVEFKCRISPKQTRDQNIYVVENERNDRSVAH